MFRERERFITQRPAEGGRRGRGGSMLVGDYRNGFLFLVRWPRGSVLYVFRT